MAEAEDRQVVFPGAARGAWQRSHGAITAEGLGCPRAKVLRLAKAEFNNHGWGREIAKALEGQTTSIRETEG